MTDQSTYTLPVLILCRYLYSVVGVLLSPGLDELLLFRLSDSHIIIETVCIIRIDFIHHIDGPVDLVDLLVIL